MEFLSVLRRGPLVNGGATRRVRMYGNDSDTTEDDQTLSSVAVTPATKNVAPAGKPPPNIPESAPIPAKFVTVPATTTKVVTVGAGPKNRRNTSAVQQSGNPPPKPSQVITLRPTELHDLRGDTEESDTDASPDKDTKKERQALQSQPASTEPNRPNTSEQIKDNIFECLHDFTAEQPGDLSISTGDKVTLLAIRPDGWWRCKNNRGEIGLVPKNVLQPMTSVDEAATEQTPQKQEISKEKQAVKEVKPAKPKPKLAEKVELPAIPEGWDHPPPTKVVELVQDGDTGLKPAQYDTFNTSIPTYRLKSIDKSNHFGYACHLFPRLSKSNLGFHDLYWYWNAEENRVKARKRKVKICKLFKAHAVGPAEFSDGFEVNFFLFDTRSSTGRQIVSNIFPANIKLESPYSIALFRNVSHPFILRSNYNLSEVVLRAEVMHHGNLVGYSDTELLSKTGHIIPNGKIAQVLHSNNTSSGTTETRLIVQVSDIPSFLVPFVDCLPDVMLCHENQSVAFAGYRNLLAAYMAKRWTAHGSTWISDTTLATLPYAVEDEDLMTLFMNELVRQRALSKPTLTEFRRIYRKTILPLIMTTPLPERPEDKQEMLQKYISSLKKHNNPVEYLSTVKSRPLDPFDYVIDLTSHHALD
uniref:SH3 domain-containing protein n=1 Tax=Panagrellus redivivus TaxID=6233 RepID=A0A7E4VC44_PANRE